jgi:hypothetical protein
VSVEAIAQTPRPAPFAPQHRGDRNAFLALLVLTWAGIVSGFGLDVIDHVRHETRAYPLITHLHALLFVGWLVLFSVQMMLVRGHRLDLHRRLGLAMAWLIPVMAVVALATAWTTQRQVAALPGTHAPQFISINLTDMLGFVTLAGAGIALRRDSPAHRRLMLLSLFFLSTAGFARLWLLTIGYGGTDSFWGFFIAVYRREHPGRAAGRLRSRHARAAASGLCAGHGLDPGQRAGGGLAVFQSRLEGDLAQAAGAGLKP